MSVSAQGVGELPAILALRPSYSRLAARFRSVPAAACIVATGISLITLTGWIANVERLKTFLYPGPVGMNPLTAVLFLACAGSLWLKRDEPPEERSTGYRAGTWLAAAVVVFSSMVLLSLLAGWPVQPDEWLFHSELATRVNQNRMAPNTAGNFILAGLALLILDHETAPGRRPAQFLTLIATSISMLALVGYLLVVLAFYRVSAHVPMALNTAVCFTALCFGILCSRLDREPMATIVSATAGGVVARRLLPAAFAVPLLLGWLRARGEQAGLYTEQMGLSLFALGNIAAFNLLIWWNARLLYHMDSQRRLADERLKQQNLLLEEAVRSERKALQALKETQSQLVQTEKLAGLGQMVAGVAHEINNPLSFVSNNVAVLQREMTALRDIIALFQKALEHAAPSLHKEHPELLASIREHCERIDLPYAMENIPDALKSCREGLKRIQQIVLDLRDFARLDESDLNDVDLSAGIKSTAHMLQARAKQKGVRIELELSPLPPVTCYPGKINQVVMNLAANAIDASPSGSAVVIRTAADNGEVRIEVADNGTGIPPEIRDRIFDPFFTTKPVGQGTGLGLSISYGIVKEHGGTISVESAPGRGSCFSVRLPRSFHVKNAVV